MSEPIKQQIQDTINFSKTVLDSEIIKWSLVTDAWSTKYYVVISLGKRNKNTSKLRSIILFYTWQKRLRTPFPAKTQMRNNVKRKNKLVYKKKFKKQ